MRVISRAQVVALDGGGGGHGGAAEFIFILFYFTLPAADTQPLANQIK